MAACMQGKAKGAWVASALASMTTSSAAAATILSAHGCKAATDVTGFGLAVSAAPD
ncbi:selenide, water dikinase, partial [Haematococcus lacustris]